MLSALSGVPLPMFFNDSLGIFLPKGELGGDNPQEMGGLLREAVDTRPLNLR